MIEWLKDAFGSLFNWLATFGNLVNSFFKFQWLCITGGVAFLMWAFEILVNDLASMATSLADTFTSAQAGMAAPGTKSTFLVNALALANTLTPLEELIAYVVLYVVIMSSLTLYRLIKSWIPTLS